MGCDPGAVVMTRQGARWLRGECCGFGGGGRTYIVEVCAEGVELGSWELRGQIESEVGGCRTCLVEGKAARR